MGRIKGWRKIHETMWENIQNERITVLWYRLIDDNYGASLYKDYQPVTTLAKNTSEYAATKSAINYMRSHPNG